MTSPSGSPGSPSSMPSVPSGQPVDYSFRELKMVPELCYEEPVSGRASMATLKPDVNVVEYLDSLSTSRGIGGGIASGQKLNASSVRLCNNQLVSLKGLDKALYHVLDDPSELVWLDASCNQLLNIEDIITMFPKLQVLYLHGNQISHMGDVIKLSKLERLSKLTLHGNPIAEQKNYKLFVAAHLPKLRSLDFSTITRLDRDKTAQWYRGYLKQQEER